MQFCAKIFHPVGRGSRNRMGGGRIRCRNEVVSAVRLSRSWPVSEAAAPSKGVGMKKTLLYAAGFVEVILCAGGIKNLLSIPLTLHRMGLRPTENPNYVAGMVVADGAIIALMVWLIILTRRKLNSMK